MFELTQYLDGLAAEGFLGNVARSLLVIVIVVAVRTFLVRMILRISPQSEVRRRWVVGIRNTSLLILVVGLAAVWLEAVQAFGTLILGLGVAFVVATKELIQCILGSIMRTVANTYKVGDRIEIAGFRGDVIDFNLLTTTLLEVGPGKSMHLRTGREIVFPNARLVDSAIVNESYMEKFVLHVLTVPIALDDDIEAAERTLAKAADAETESFLPEARRNMADLERKHGLDGLPIQTRTSVQLTDPDKAQILVRFPAPVGRQWQIEQKILRAYLEDRRKRLAILEGPDARPAEGS